jgi:hypothetical protein
MSHFPGDNSQVTEPVSFLSQVKHFFSINENRLRIVYVQQASIWLIHFFAYPVNNSTQEISILRFLAV